MPFWLQGSLRWGCRIPAGPPQQPSTATLTSDAYERLSSAKGRPGEAQELQMCLRGGVSADSNSCEPLGPSSWVRAGVSWGALPAAEPRLGSQGGCGVWNSPSLISRKN